VEPGRPGEALNTVLELAACTRRSHCAQYSGQAGYFQGGHGWLAAGPAIPGTGSTVYCIRYSVLHCQDGSCMWNVVQVDLQCAAAALAKRTPSAAAHTCSTAHDCFGCHVCCWLSCSYQAAALRSPRSCQLPLGRSSRPVHCGSRGHPTVSPRRQLPASRRCMQLQKCSN
jgi:hypothetical protein